VFVAIFDVGQLSVNFVFSNHQKILKSSKISEIVKLQQAMLFVRLAWFKIGSISFYMYKVRVFLLTESSLLSSVLIDWLIDCFRFFFFISKKQAINSLLPVLFIVKFFYISDKAIILKIISR